MKKQSESSFPRRWESRSLMGLHFRGDSKWRINFIRNGYIFLLACLLVENGLARTSLPIPRFASLRAEKVNLRVGPGTEYPIDWVIVRPNLPVQIVAEYETWRQIKDSEGTTGWVHQSMLSGKRHVIIRQDLCKLVSSCERNARPLAKLKTGLVCRLKKCKSGYCQIQTGSYKGWVPIEAIWGVDTSDWK